MVDFAFFYSQWGLDHAIEDLVIVQNLKEIQTND